MYKSASIIICTFNRSSSLIETLESIMRMKVPKHIEWEVLVVDNNSNDDTKQEVEKLINRRSTNIKYLFEKKQGKAYALNQAVGKAKGDILAFTDDDALVESSWLIKIIKTFDELNPECVGGKVVPIWLSRRPGWLSDNLLNVLAMLDYGDTVYEIKPNCNKILYGVNYAFKKTFFNKHGLFKTELCSRGAGNEDHDIFQRLQKSGGRAVYHPEILVYHKVFPERMTKYYFRKWHYLVGIDRANICTETKARFLGIEGYMVRKFLIEVPKFLYSLITLNDVSNFRNQLTLILYCSFFLTRFKQYFKGQLPTISKN